MAKRAPRLQFTEEERASPELAPAIEKADKRIKKLEKAEARIPKKEVKQRVVDSDGKITTRLSFEEKKPPSKLSHAAKISGDAVLHGVHREVRQSNDGDNAGVDAANTLAEDAESAYQVGREIHHAHALKPYRKAHRAEKKADKANVKALNQEFAQQNDGFSSNPYSRWQQKRAIKREYAAAKAGRGTANTVKASEITKKAAEKSEEGGGTAMSEQLLRLDHITMQFGGVVAVDDLELEVNEGEIVALIGPNGAGKTTAFNVITGVYQPTNGAVWFDGAKIIENHPQGKMKKQYKGQCDGLYTETLSPTPDKITRAGMARTFQNIRLWKTQTVFNNVLIAKHCRSTSSVFSAAFRLNRKEEAAQRAQVEELLEIVGLSDVKNELATSLPYGKQRRLEIARALATRPSLLLLDEPAAGMNPQESGHGHFRPHLCAGFRQADRQRHTGGDPKKSARHRRVSGGGGRCLKLKTSRSTTAAFRPSGAFLWKYRTAGS